MDNQSSNIQLFKGITPNVPLLSYDKNLFCMKKRPCWRLQKCKICWAKCFTYYQKQIESVVESWSLTDFMTISITQPVPFTKDSFKVLKAIRQRLTKHIGRKGKYILVFTLLNNRDEFKPHFHAIVTALNEDKIDLIMIKYGCNLKYKISLKSIGRGTGFFKQKLTYMLNQNLRPSLKAKPKRLRLFTASNGFYTGRPKDLEKFAWLV